MTAAAKRRTVINFEEVNDGDKALLDQELKQTIDRQEKIAIKEIEKNKPKRAYTKTSVDRMRAALIAALGEKEEIIIKQIEIQAALRLSKPTWLAGIRELKNEFDIVKLQRGTLLRKRFDGQ